MHTIDRYLLRQYIEVYVICFCSLTGLYVVFDAFGHLDEFLQWVESSGELFSVLGEYYAYRSVFFFERISGMVALIAAMFTLTWIQRFNELTAISAAGVATRRVIVPIVAASFAVSLGAAATREFAIPRIKEELVKEPKDLKGERAQELQPSYDQQTDVLLQGKSSVLAERRIDGPNFILPKRLDGRTISLEADKAWYRDNTPGGYHGYLMTKVTQPNGFCRRPSLYLDKRPVVLTPADNPWLKPDQCFVVSDVSFEELVNGERLRQFLGTRELIAGLTNRSLDFGAGVRVAIHARFVQPLLDMVLVFIGLPFVVGGERRNVFLAIGICILITSLFMVVVLACHWLGSISLVSPALAAWLPMIIFAPVAAWLSHTIFR